MPWAPTPHKIDWHGPRAVTARPVAGGLIAVDFDAPVALNMTAACPAAMLASPLGKLCCTGAGFELTLGDHYAPVVSAEIAPGKPNTILLKPSTETMMQGAPTSVRYAYADWPVCSVRNTKSSGGSTTEPLPARIFQKYICGSDRCPGVLCPFSHCPVSPPAAAALPPPGAQEVAAVEEGELADTMAAVGSVLAARAEVVAPPPPPENFIPASSPSCWYTGRTQINADGTRSFDWEGTQLWLNIQDASYIKMVMKTSGGITGRFSIELNTLEVASLWVGAGDNPQNRLSNNTAVLSKEYRVADALSSGNTVSGVKNNVTVRATLILEPSFTGAGPAATFTLVGWKTDGTALPPSEPRPRRIELVGDSISAGYGARGNAALHDTSLVNNLDRLLCPINDQTSGNIYTYNWKIAEHFNADLAAIAWSGKGMFRNCCDPGEKMPAYWMQTLGGGNYTRDWDHSRYIPDMMLINLGTVFT